METAIVLACIVGGPLMGMWMGRAWAKANGLELRRPEKVKAQNLAA